MRYASAESFARRLLLLSASMLLAVPLAAAERTEVVIPAEKLAPPEVRSDTLTLGKWWLRRTGEETKAPGGAILLTGRPSQEKLTSKFWDVIPISRFVPYRVPALEIDPRVSGWYRIYAGLYYDDFDYYSPPLLQGKLTGEPYPEYLEAPHGTPGKIGEAYWKAADLTGKKIHLIQPPGPMPHIGSGWLGGVTHLRLVPMSDAEVAAAKKEIELPPVERRLFAMLDTTDEIYWYGDAQTEDDIRTIVYRHGQAGFGRIYWRCYGTYLDNSLSVPEAAPRWSESDEAAYIAKEQSKAGWMRYIELSRRFDPLKVAVEYGRTVNCDVHAMVRFTNHNRPPYSNFWHDHPEFYAQMLAFDKRDPKSNEPIPRVPYERTPYPRVLSFAYPEVRTYYVKFFEQLASTGTKGIMIDMLRHPPIAGFEPVVTEAFKDYNHPQVQDHLSEYFRLFLVELREAIGPDIEISVRCSGPSAYALKGKEWIEAGLINTIVDGHWYSGNGIRPTIDATVAAVGTKGRAMAAAEIGNVDPKEQYRSLPGILSPQGILALANGYSGRGVANFGLYESTLHVWSPDARRAIRQAGWDYDPTKVAK